jgi:hypothetical protein
MKHHLGLMVIITMALGSQSSNASVPASWLITNESESFTFSKARDIPEASLTTGFYQELHQIMDFTFAVTQPSALLPIKTEANSNRTEQPWYLKSITTEVAVEASGVVGLLGGTGKAAIELEWARTPDSIKRLQDSHQEKRKSTHRRQGDVIEPVTSPFRLQTSFSNQQLEIHAQQLANLVFATGQVKRSNKLKERILRKLLKTTAWLRKMKVESSQHGWVPITFEAKMEIQADVMAFPPYTIGGGVEIALVWDLDSEEEWNLTNSDPSLHSFLNVLSPHLDALEKFDSQQSIFRLVDIELAVGVGMNGQIGVASFAAEAEGTVSFEKKPLLNSNLPVSSFSEKPLESLPVVDKSHELKQVSAKTFQRALKKALSISRVVVSAAESYAEKHPPNSTEKSTFQLEGITVEFEITASGTIGLVTVSNEATIALGFVRQAIHPHHFSHPNEIVVPPMNEINLVFGPRGGVNLGLVNLVAMPFWGFCWSSSM